MSIQQIDRDLDGNFRGPSSQTKPTGQPVGTLFSETDSGNTYIYNGLLWLRVAERIPSKLISGNYSILVTDRLLMIDTALTPITLTLPGLTAGEGMELFIKKVAVANTVTISSPDGLIDGLASQVLGALYSNLHLAGNGIRWDIL